MNAFVTCPKCKNGFDTEKVEFLNIAEDMQGRDEMTFTCPACNEPVTSLVRTGNPPPPKAD